MKLWLERKTLSEYIIRHHIREIETINEASFGSSRRPSRTERALNDPLRDNEGMLVDEYGRYGDCSCHMVLKCYMSEVICSSVIACVVPSMGHIAVSLFHATKMKGKKEKQFYVIHVVLSFFH